MRGPDGSVLIWVESDAEPRPEPGASRHRGMIVVAHGSGRGTTEESFVISYPIDTDDHMQHVAAVSGVLEAMGWSVLASRRGTTDGGSVNSAVLTSTARSGSAQRLWLAEPVRGAQARGAPADAPFPGLRSAMVAGEVRSREIRDQVEAWVNEGGAGDDVPS